MKFTVALAQIDNRIGDLKYNINKHIDFIRRAKDGGADLVVFPELSLTGYSVKDSVYDVALRIDSSLLAPLLKESEEISIIAGVVEESSEYGLYNSAFLFEKSSAKCIHRKVYPPTYGMFEEMRYFSAGTKVEACNTALGQIGVLICEDIWHLPLPYLLAQDGAEAVIAIAASPTRLSGDAALEIAQVNYEQHKAYARLLSTYVIFCNRVGFEDGVNFWGGSTVIDPSGDTLVQAKHFEEDMVFAEVDGNEVRRARRGSRHFLDDNIDLVIRSLEKIRRRRDE